LFSFLLSPFYLYLFSLMASAPPALPTQEPKDLGFGAVVAAQSRVRLMNRDGSFNVQRGGRLQAIFGNPYHSLLTISWPAFLGVLATVYIVANLVFALLFMACGPGALGETDNAFPAGSFLQAFFFSVETFATIGYGAIVPETVRANFLVLLESFVSLVSIALATGIIFARFSRPIPRIRFSAQAVIAPYMGRTGFMFRIANARRNEIVGIEATVILARFVTTSGVRSRSFTELSLERKRVIFFSLSWTVVHPIDETSPLWNVTPAELRDSEAEFLILLSGTDETFFQTVSTRGSYTAAELLWGHKFTNIFLPPAPDGIVRIDLGLLDGTEAAALPEPVATR
jgi:inward rectifier potassium channel